ncbi:hypothetical protein AYI68_g2017 [Smittium mucronatum]|uniref:Uncharacterized protein n=1 Tax=Smittium mucronatum TaxID=133383 RepID=A0A1R0H3V8_9FUNG|nr:hypothetical protein AYI68_g2017 [Smittium mucronatum]
METLHEMNFNNFIHIEYVVNSLGLGFDSIVNDDMILNDDAIKDVFEELFAIKRYIIDKKIELYGSNFSIRAFSNSRPPSALSDASFFFFLKRILFIQFMLQFQFQTNFI